MREVNNPTPPVIQGPAPDPVPPRGRLGRYAWTVSVDARLRDLLAWVGDASRLLGELSRMMTRTVTPDELDDSVTTVRGEVATGMASMRGQVDSTVAAVRGEVAAKVAAIRQDDVATAANTAAVTVPAAVLGVGGVVDVPLALDEPMPDSNYRVASPVLTSSNATLLGAVAVVAVTGKTTTAVTVRLRNTGATALTVPAGALTCMAKRPA